MSNYIFHIKSIHIHINDNKSRRVKFSVDIIYKIYTGFCIRIIRPQPSFHLPQKKIKKYKNINVVLITRAIKLISFVSWELSWRNAYKSAERNESSTDKKLPDQNQNPRVVKSQQVRKKKYNMLWPLRIYPMCKNQISLTWNLNHKTDLTIAILEAVLKKDSFSNFTKDSEANKTRPETRHRIGSQNSHGFTPTVTQV